MLSLVYHIVLWKTYLINFILVIVFELRLFDIDQLIIWKNPHFLLKFLFTL